MLNISSICLVLLIVQVLFVVSSSKRSMMQNSIESNSPHIKQRATLPDKVIVGYANWNQCDDKIIQAVKDGVNVMIWFSINLAVDLDGKPTITNGPNWDCVAQKVSVIKDMNLDCIHLISIGGWNSPHPDTTNRAEEVFANWHHWNQHVIARPQLGFDGFDGFDWDIEGNDTPSSPYNQFTIACLDLMGKFSQLAKQLGYVVAMAPAESYLDPTTSQFDRSLLHEYPEWKDVIPTFAYHGHNIYAYLWSRYGQTLLTKDTVMVDTFDFVTIQLYEGYSHAEYKISILKQHPVDVLVDFVQTVVTGWMVDFSSDIDLEYPSQMVAIPANKLVIGLANGWAGDGKFLLIYPEDVGVAYHKLSSIQTPPRGFAFWNILDEGLASPQDPSRSIFMAKGLNAFLKTRET